MASRPTFLDVSNRPSGLENTPFLRTPSPHDGLPSPRAGDIPPALSPLDAFALQGRMLAQKLEEGRRHNRKISRLPHTTIASELAKPRPGYENARSLSPRAEDGRNISAMESPGGGEHSWVETKQELKHRSIYPVFQSLEKQESVLEHKPASIQELAISPPVDDQPIISKDYFGPWGIAPLANGPSTDCVTQEERPSIEIDFGPGPAVIEESSSLRSRTLARSRSPAMRRLHQDNARTRPVSPEPIGAGLVSQPVQLAKSDINSQDQHSSNSRNRSHPNSPRSSYLAPPRSSSVSSDYSLVERPSVSLSRPLSRDARRSVDTRPSFEMSTRQINANDFMNSGLEVGNAPIGFALTSTVVVSATRAPLPWDDPTDNETLRSSNQTNSSPPLPKDLIKPTVLQGPYVSNNPRAIPGLESEQKLKIAKRKPKAQKVKMEIGDPSSRAPRPTFSTTSSSFVLSPQDIPVRRSSTSRFDAPTSPRLRSHKSNPSLPLLFSPSKLAAQSPNLHPPTRRQKPNLARLITPESPINLPPIHPTTPAEHLALGISLHESGSDLQKSTYHLRLAAKAGLPDAMLMYALACRHGWGIRANEREGVAWLRKAIEASGADVSAVEAGVPFSTPTTTETTMPLSSSSSPSTQQQLALQSTRSLAPSLYELGISHLHGWGVTRSPTVALRYFSAAASLDDKDALAEAGECYAKGLGCKRDLKRAAELLRRAEGSKGSGSVGRSWIWKDKYGGGGGGGVGKEGGREGGKEKEKERGRLGMRGIFGGGGGGGGGAGSANVGGGKS